MSNAQLLLAVVLLQQGLFGVMWLVSGRLGLARRPARHWAAATWLVALGMSLILLRGQASPWLTAVGANVANIASFIFLRRGIQVFARRPPTDPEHLLVLGLGGAGLAATVVWGHDLMPVVVVTGATIGWTLLRSAGEVRRGFGIEFGRGTALWCALPVAFVGGLFVVRGLAAPFASPALAGPLNMPGSGNTAIVFASLALGLVLHATLIAMVVLRLVRRLQHQSDHDDLTGLLSRRAMQLLLQAEMQRQRRYGTGCAMLSVDIDHFKQINDRYGHAVGDAVLVRVAQTLQSTAREVDRVARMGGEEFCVLLPGGDSAGADRAAQRLLAAVRALVHPETGGALTVSVSIGVVVVDAPPELLPALLRRLDQALYAAKAAGRDRCVHAGPAPARTAPATATGPG